MELNCLGDVCPIPVIKTRNALKEMPENGVLTVTVDNLEACENVEKMVKDAGHGINISKSGNDFILAITKGTGVTDTAESSAEPVKKGHSVVAVGSDMMGAGDIDLGRTLLKTFLYTLTELDTPPKTVIFYNAGVKLTTEGSASINDLKSLAERGVDVVSCGACLNYYHLTDKLSVGRVSNMYEIASLMLSAGNVVKP